MDTPGGIVAETSQNGRVPASTGAHARPHMADALRFAAIDVGSNALRLRIVEADGTTPAYREVLSMRAPVRLGREMSSGVPSRFTKIACVP